MEPIVFTPELASTIAAVILSCLFSYVPKLNVKFAALDPELKRAIMLGLLVVITGAIFGLACADLILVENFTCDQYTATRFVAALIAAMVANQGTYTISPRTPAVKRLTAAK